MIYLLYTIHIVTCIFLILVVLLQQGRGADLSVFGGGATQAAFGARGAATVLHKLTVICFVLFIVTTMSIGIAQRRASGSSVLSGVRAGEGSAAPAETPVPAASEAAEDTAVPPVDETSETGTEPLEEEPATDAPQP